jgi:CRP-like cAMP-binding protein
MGRRSALGSVAHLFCELFVRLRAVGLTQARSFHFPVTQAELGDLTGLSTVHVNRVAQELRGSGIITWQGRTLTIVDWDRLKAVAEFNPTYLSLGQEPR